MTDDELRAYAERYRESAAKIGSMSPAWDIIYDIEAVLEGRLSILNREELERMIQRLGPFAAGQTEKPT